LDPLPNATAVDRDRMRAVHELEKAYRARLDGWPRGRALPAALREVPWMLEELRISQFAQGLGTRGPVSAKRIRRALDEATA
jgi:ATP-dependent helicase HrpA